MSFTSLKLVEDVGVHISPDSALLMDSIVAQVSFSDLGGHVISLESHSA